MQIPHLQPSVRLLLSLQLIALPSSGPPRRLPCV